MTALHACFRPDDEGEEESSYSHFSASVYARETTEREWDDDDNDAHYVSCDASVCLSPVSEDSSKEELDYYTSSRGAEIRTGHDRRSARTSTIGGGGGGGGAVSVSEATTANAVSSGESKKHHANDDVTGAAQGGGGGLAARFPMIHPNSAARTNWDVVIGVCILYSGIFVPLSIAFSPTRRGIGIFGVIELLTDFTLLCDVCANFRTGFVDRKGALVMDPRQARRRYLRTWFIVDLAAALPFDLMLAPISENAYKSTSVQVMRLARLLRFSRLFRSMDKATRFLPISVNVLRMTKLIISISLFAHFDACAMFFAARMDSSAESWIDTNSLVDESRVVQYLWSLFMALSHMLCIGYGPKGNPSTLTELWMTLGSMLIGASLYVILIGLITANLMMINGASPPPDNTKPQGDIDKDFDAAARFTASTESTPGNSRRGSAISMSQLNSISHHVLLLMSSALLASNGGAANGGGGVGLHPGVVASKGHGNQQLLQSISAHHDVAALAAAASMITGGDKTTVSRLSHRRSSI